MAVAVASAVACTEQPAGVNGDTTPVVIEPPVATVARVVIADSSPPYPDSPLLSPLPVGVPVPLVALAYDSAGNLLAGRKTTWSTSDSTLATIDDKGRVRGIKSGVVTVSATVGGIRATSGGLTVYLSLYAWPDKSGMPVGMKRHMVLLLADKSGAAPDSSVIAGVKWQSSNPGVATVDAAGNVTAVAPGQATLNITYWGEVVHAAVVVRQQPSLRFAQIDGGGCGVTTDGDAYCWGTNINGELGTTESVDDCEEWGPGHGGVPAANRWACSASPVRVASPVKFKSVSVNGLSRCGVGVDDRLYCWGSPFPIVNDRFFTPVRMNDTLAVASFIDPCALDASGREYCWRDINGPPEKLVAVAGDMRWQQFSAQYNARCGISSGTAYCWGDLYDGQLGVGPPEQFAPGCPTTNCVLLTPTPVSSTVKFTTYQLGSYGFGAGTVSCGLDAAGHVYCAGKTPLNGQTVNTSVPTQVQNVPPLKSLAFDQGVCGLDAGGGLWCWGNLTGSGASVTSTNVPTRVMPSLSFSAVSTQKGVYCGLTLDGVAYCWGSNVWAGLGGGSIDKADTAVVRLVGQP